MALLGGTAALGLGVALVAGGDDAERDPGEEPGAGFPSAMWVGPTDDPEIAAILQEMRDEWVSRGVDLDVITPEEIFRMRKAPGQPLAIPPRNHWYRIVPTILRVYMPLRYAADVPFQITSGYRSPDYNEAVGGTPGSRHQANEAIDFVPSSKGDQIGRDAAALYLAEGAELKMGLGTYGFPAHRFHIDTGHNQRTWENTRRYIELVRAA